MLKNMRTTNIAELKNHLSSFLADVKRGEEILISDRNQPIAKIVPLHNTADFSTEELALAAAGILRLPEESEISTEFLKEKRANVNSQTAIKAVTDERDEY
jgi:prevent-host-death family protein